MLEGRWSAGKRSRLDWCCEPALKYDPGIPPAPPPVAPAGKHA